MGSFTNDLQLIDLLLGESAGSGYANWGDAADDNFSKIEKALTATTDITVTTANVTLTDTDIKCLRFTFSGTKTANRSVIFPTRKRFYFVSNQTGGSFTLTGKCSGQPGIEIRSGVDILYCDGTDISSLMTGPHNRFLNSIDLEPPPAGRITIFARNDDGKFGTAELDKTTGQFLGFTEL
jgi:hypothetical protein